MAEWFAQGPHGVRFEWGLAGAAAMASSSACLVIVDVLSFTTAVTVAVEAGTQVIPYAWRDDTAADFARQRRAELAAAYRIPSADSPWTLSPAALRCAPFTARLVLPSPNGSAISAVAARGSATVIAACLRNATAAGRWLARHSFGTPGQPVTVIAAGEHWPDGALRPALEDLLGAGAIITALHDYGRVSLSAEAEAARSCYEATADVAGAVMDSASGRELIEQEFDADVSIAVEIDSCRLIPVLSGQAFTALE